MTAANAATVARRPTRHEFLPVNLASSAGAGMGGVEEQP